MNADVAQSVKGDKDRWSLFKRYHKYYRGQYIKKCDEYGYCEIPISGLPYAWFIQSGRYSHLMMKMSIDETPDVYISSSSSSVTMNYY